MCRQHPARSIACRFVSRRGFTLAELLIAIAITSVISLALGGLASAIYSSNDYVKNQATVTQHARVVLERIKRNVETAHASRDFPGFHIVETTASAEIFPDTIAVWQPETSAANPEGLPLVSELIVYMPNPNNPEELWEVSDRSDNSAVPERSQASQWATLIAGLQVDSGVTRNVLTNLVRRSKVSNADVLPRANLRFESRLLPSDSELASYDAASANWDDLSWPQSLYSEGLGIRQAWVRMELQLIPPDTMASDGNDSADHVVPYFGSAALYHEVER